MALRPAEYCCGACPLLQGVQIIASCTVASGTYTLLSMLMRGPNDRVAQSETMAAVEFMKMIVHSFALLAGLKGLIGVMFRDPRHLRVLFLYHIVELFTMGIALIVREIEACKELDKIQRLTKSKRTIPCSSARVALFADFCIHAILFLYFAYIIWSLMNHLEAGEMGIRPPLLGGEHELTSMGGTRGDMADPWLLLGQHADAQQSLMQQRAPLNMHGGGANSGPAPFSGAPRRLTEEELPAAEPFRGTPHRLA
mmetsp:Transcript_81746/g.210500  ORF Transcript_81746/g.210500 Transcript_81746/m.210500 type:complete len:254 (-) Transcript_81746:151-912(-)